MRTAIICAFLLAGLAGCKSEAQEKSQADFKVQKTKEQWKSILSEDEYTVLREAGTEPPYSSELLNVKEPGTFICAGCNNPLYETEHKFDSGTGWPSFDRAIDDALAFSSDRKIGYERKESLCGACGGHLGHIFNDGPRETTGKRHCINGDALKFVKRGDDLPEILK